MIPTSKDLCAIRLLKSRLSTDTCNTVKSVHVHFKDLVFGLCRNMGIPEKDCIMLYSGFCYQHMRNILHNGAEIFMDVKWNTQLSSYLKINPPHLRIQCTLSNLDRMVDKELNHCGGYAKGHGGDFWYFMETHHKGVTWLPIVRVLEGA